MSSKVSLDASLLLASRSTPLVSNLAHLAVLHVYICFLLSVGSCLHSHWIKARVLCYSENALCAIGKSWRDCSKPAEHRSLSILFPFCSGILPSHHHLPTILKPIHSSPIVCSIGSHPLRCSRQELGCIPRVHGLKTQPRGVGGKS